MVSTSPSPHTLLCRLSNLVIDLHPLAIEDVLHTRDHSRSKADYYSKHLFIRAVCHRLLNANNSIEELQDALSNANNIVPPQPFSSSSPFSSPSSADIPIPRSESPSDMGDEDERGMKGGGDEERVPYVEREHAVVNGVSRKTTLMYLERDAQRVRGDGEKTKAQRALERLDMKEVSGFAFFLSPPVVDVDVADRNGWRRGRRMRLRWIS